MENVNLHTQEGQKTPRSLNTKIFTLRHFIVKILKAKEKILKTAREMKLITYKANPLRLTGDVLLGKKEKWRPKTVGQNIQSAEGKTTVK